MSKNKYNDQLRALTGEQEQVNTKLLEREDVPGTPFKVVGNDDEGWMVTLGRFAVSDRSSKQDCLYWIDNLDWNLLISVISVVVDGIEAMKKEAAIKTLNDKYSEDLKLVGSVNLGEQNFNNPERIKADLEKMD